MVDNYLTVHITPRAKREGLVVEGETVRVSVSAPADRGAANAAVLGLLANSLGLPRRDLRIVTGETGPRKLIAIEGFDAEVALRRLRVADEKGENAGT